MGKTQEQYIKMTTTPVNKLIIKLAIPTVISMLITTIYNVTDTYFVSEISVPASGATGVVFSLMGIIQAFGFTYGQGSGSLISRKLGEKDTKNASIYASVGFFAALMTGLLILLFGLVFLTPMMKLFGSTDTILPYACDYGKFILIAAPAMVCSCLLNNILRYEGRASLAMIGLTTGSVINIGLDPLLIYKFNLGISGAGIATMFSQYLSMGILLSVFLMNKTQTKISIKKVSFDKKYITEIVLTGCPSFARQGLSGISNMLLNRSARAFGDPCIAAMSIAGRVGMMIFSVCIGIGQGFQPVCGYNYGAKRNDRVKDGMKFMWMLATAVMIVLSAFCFAFAPGVVSMFREEAEIIKIGSLALRVTSASMIFLPVIVTANMTFQCTGQKMKAFLLACVQSGIYLIPVLYILPRIIGITGIEISYAVSYLLASLTAAPFILKFYKKLA